MLIDSHTHLASFAAKGTLEGTLARAAESGVTRHITVGTSTDDWDTYRNLSAAHPGTVYHSVGLHPCDVDEDWEEQVAQIGAHFALDPLPVALGEIGLDHFHLPKYPDEAAEIKSLQRAAFIQQLHLAEQFDAPIIVHSRNAFADCVAVIDEVAFDWSKVVFHCFADGPDEIRQINERGGRGSFTGIITYKSAENVRAAAIAQGLERIMVETDAPYLAPVPKRGKPNEPAYLRHTADFCADMFGIPVNALAAVATENTDQFFGLNRKT